MKAKKIKAEDKEETWPIEELIEEWEQEDGPLTFGDSLRARRDLDDRPLSEYAKSLGLSVARLKDLEADREVPTAKMASELAKKLEVFEDHFIEQLLDGFLRNQGLSYTVRLSPIEKPAEDNKTKENNPLTFGQNLRSMREAGGESLSEYAKVLGLSVSRLKALEADREVPTAKMASELAKKLEVFEDVFIKRVLDDYLRVQGLPYTVRLYVKKVIQRQ